MMISKPIVIGLVSENLDEIKPKFNSKPKKQQRLNTHQPK